MDLRVNSSSFLREARSSSFVVAGVVEAMRVAAGRVDGAVEGAVDGPVVGTPLATRDRNVRAATTIRNQAVPAVGHVLARASIIDEGVVQRREARAKVFVHPVMDTVPEGQPETHARDG